MRGNPTYADPSPPQQAPDLERMAQQRTHGYLDQQTILRALNQQRMLAGQTPAGSIEEAVGTPPKPVHQTEVAPLQVDPSQFRGRGISVQEAQQGGGDGVLGAIAQAIGQMGQQRQRPQSQQQTASVGNAPTSRAETSPAPAQGAPASAGGRVEQLQSGVRKQPLSPKLVAQLEHAAAQTELLVKVTSGGQPSQGGSSVRTGSHRHDWGGAADLHLVDPKTDTKLSMRNPADVARMSEFVTHAVAAGATGAGAGQSYMGDHTIHVGGGAKTHWGGAPWIGPAVAKGRSNPVTPGGGGGTQPQAGAGQPSSGTGRLPTEAELNDKSVPVGERFNNPFNMWHDKYATIHGGVDPMKQVTPQDRPTSFPSKLDGAAAAIRKMAESPLYSGKTMTALISQWVGHGTSYAPIIEQATGISRHTVITPEFLKTDAGLNFLKTMARYETKWERPYPLSDAEWRQARDKAFGHPSQARTAAAPASVPAAPQQQGVPTGVQPPASAAPPVPHGAIPDQAGRPAYYEGSISIDGKTFKYGSGGGTTPSAPYGTFPITPEANGPIVSQLGGFTLNGNKLYDPGLGRMRVGIALHPQTLDDLRSAGCFAVPQEQWPAFKQALQAKMQREGPLQITVRPDGTASIDRVNPQAAAAAQQVPPAALQQPPVSGAPAPPSGRAAQTLPQAAAPATPAQAPIINDRLTPQQMNPTGRPPAAPAVAPPAPPPAPAAAVAAPPNRTATISVPGYGQMELYGGNPAAVNKFINEKSPVPFMTPNFKAAPGGPRPPGGYFELPNEMGGGHVFVPGADAAKLRQMHEGISKYMGGVKLNDGAQQAPAQGGQGRRGALPDPEAARIQQLARTPEAQAYASVQRVADSPVTEEDVEQGLREEYGDPYGAGRNALRVEPETRWPPPPLDQGETPPSADFWARDRQYGGGRNRIFQSESTPQPDNDITLPRGEERAAYRAPAQDPEIARVRARELADRGGMLPEGFAKALTQATQQPEPGRVQPQLPQLPQAGRQAPTPPPQLPQLPPQSPNVQTQGYAPPPQSMQQMPTPQVQAGGGIPGVGEGMAPPAGGLGTLMSSALQMPPQAPAWQTPETMMAPWQSGAAGFGWGGAPVFPWSTPTWDLDFGAGFGGGFDLGGFGGFGGIE